VTPASSFCTIDYGVQDRWVGNIEGTREYRGASFKITRLDRSAGARSLARRVKRQVEALKLLKDALGPDIPFTQTIFSPLARPRTIAGGTLMIKHMRTAPRSVQDGLNTITDKRSGKKKRKKEKKSTFALYRPYRRSGSADFYAVQHASYAIYD